jgi:hypothetical protein
MRKLVVLLIVAGVLLAGDQAARVYAQSKLAERAAAYYPPSTAADASIRSFPFVGRLLVMGDVVEMKVGMENLQADVILIRRLDLDLRDVELDRNALFRGRVELIDIGSGRIDALIDGPSLAKAAQADLRFHEDSVEIHKRVGGADVFARGRASVSNNVLRLQPTSVQGVGLPASAFALTLRISGPEILPCDAVAEPVEGGLLVGCNVKDVPPSLVRAARSGPSGP